MRVTKLFFLLAFPIAMGISFASCSDDDKDDVLPDNSSVVGVWDFKEATSAFKFSDAFIKDKSVEELKVFTDLVTTYLKTESDKDASKLATSKFQLAKDFSFERQMKNEEGELETKKGIYTLDAALKLVTFTLSKDNVQEFNLDGVTMTYDRVVSPTDVSLGTGESSGIKPADIKSASVSHEYIKKSK